MERELHRIIFFIVIFSLIISGSFSYAAVSEEEYLKKITTLADSGSKKELVRVSGQYFKDYPAGELVADVRMILAENEPDPGKAIEQYRIIISKYRYFAKRDIAQYKICEILYLQSKWDDLRSESLKGVDFFKNSSYITKFRFLLAKAYINQERFDSAKRACLDIIGHDHDYNNLSECLILLSYINRNIYGYSKSYLYSLNEIISGFGKSDNMPAALFLLGRYYENREDFDKAFSVYTDVVKKYPKSPEAGMSGNRLSGLAKYNPRKTDYMPDSKAIDKSDKIEIQPEIDLDETEEGIEANRDAGKDILYSVSLGPFKDIAHAREIKNLIRKDFRNVEIADTREGFYIYVGKYTNTESVIKIKIRLAEEFGINGNVVKMISDSKRVYIYE